MGCRGARDVFLFIQQYRACSSLDDSPKALELAWTQLDNEWMDTGMPLQLVHDIEDGYGNPLLDDPPHRRIPPVCFSRYIALICFA